MSTFKNMLFAALTLFAGVAFAQNSNVGSGQNNNSGNSTSTENEDNTQDSSISNSKKSKSQMQRVIPVAELLTDVPFKLKLNVNF
jgi:hypothetical protein